MLPLAREYAAQAEDITLRLLRSHIAAHMYMRLVVRHQLEQHFDSRR